MRVVFMECTAATLLRKTTISRGIKKKFSREVWIPLPRYIDMHYTRHIICIYMYYIVRARGWAAGRRVWNKSEWELNPKAHPLQPLPYILYIHVTRFNVLYIYIHTEAVSRVVAFSRQTTQKPFANTPPFTTFTSTSVKRNGERERESDPVHAHQRRVSKMCNGHV